MTFSEVLEQRLTSVGDIHNLEEIEFVTGQTLSELCRSLANIDGIEGSRYAIELEENIESGSVGIRASVQLKYEEWGFSPQQAVFGLLGDGFTYRPAIEAFEYVTELESD